MEQRGCLEINLHKYNQLVRVKKQREFKGEKIISINDAEATGHPHVHKMNLNKDVTTVGRTSLVAWMVKNLPAMPETRVWSLNWKDPLEAGMATHSSILAWRIPWTEEPGGAQSMGSQRVRHAWATKLSTTVGKINSEWVVCPKTKCKIIRLLLYTMRIQVTLGLVKIF